ncbi:MAG TPA: hypothetical protein VFC54_00775 [Pseudolabrys sp.]|nr:hypothetical protein [Pseudolabrys sp.]
MKDVAKRSFVVAIWLSAVLVFTAIAVTIVIEFVRPTHAHLEAHKFELEIFKVILAGFVVGMLGILIPAVVTEARHRFEQRKESRVAYSAAKTTIDYLKLRLATASLEEAATALQQAHFNKTLLSFTTTSRSGLRSATRPRRKWIPTNGVTRCMIGYSRPARFLRAMQMRGTHCHRQFVLSCLTQPCRPSRN